MDVVTKQPEPTRHEFRDRGSPADGVAYVPARELAAEAINERPPVAMPAAAEMTGTITPLPPGVTTVTAHVLNPAPVPKPVPPLTPPPAAAGDARGPTQIMAQIKMHQSALASLGQELREAVAAVKAKVEAEIGDAEKFLADHGL